MTMQTDSTYYPLHGGLKVFCIFLYLSSILYLTFITRIHCMSVLHVRSFNLTKLNFDTDFNLINSSALREMPWCIVIFQKYQLSRTVYCRDPDNFNRLASPLVVAPHS
jgi:hypothetical protein